MQRKRSKKNRQQASPVLTAAILDVVQNQLEAGTPPETKQTFERLLAEGHALEEARRLIACVVASEVFSVLQRREPYNADRYIAALQRLPELPWDT